MTDDNDSADLALGIMKMLSASENYDWSYVEGQKLKQNVIDASRVAVEANPDDAFMTYLHGLALFRGGNKVGAAEVLERLDDLMVEDGMEMYDYLLGQCYEHDSCSRPDDAYVRYKRISERLKDHEVWLRESGGDSDGWDRFPGLGEDGRFALAPDNLVADPVSVCRHVGEFLASRGDAADAERCLRVACDLDPSWSNHWSLAHFLFSQHRWVEAETAFRLADETFHDMASLNMIGLCLAEQGRSADAESAFRLALTLEDNLAGDLIEGSVHSNLGNLLLNLGRFDQAVAEFKLAVTTRYLEAPEQYVYELALTLYRAGKDSEAESEITKCFPLSESLGSEHAARIFNLLGEIRLKHRDRWLDALAMFGESIRRVATDPEVWANLARVERRLGLLYDAKQSLEQALELAPNNALFKSRLDDILSPHCSTHYESFAEFLEDGKIWLDPAKWTNPEKSSVLRSIFARDLRWPNYVEEFPFGDYEISAEFLDESLARAESLKSLLNFEVEFPVRLETPELFIAMERDGDMLRSFVGSGAMGVAVLVNLTNWDLHYLSDDSDAMFAAGVSLNFFIDCSMNLSLHPKYERVNETTTKPAATQTNPFSTWTTNAAFAADIEGILTGRLSQPPKAHRVKGFIRTLTERRPTDEARDRAPAFIRRNMGPDDTFVRPHQRGGGDAAERLYTRLRTHSSLADFLATAPKL